MNEKIIWLHFYILWSHSIHLPKLKNSFNVIQSSLQNLNICPNPNFRLILHSKYVRNPEMKTQLKYRTLTILYPCQGIWSSSRNAHTHTHAVNTLARTHRYRFPVRRICRCSLAALGVQRLTSRGERSERSWNRAEQERSSWEETSRRSRRMANRCWELGRVTRHYERSCTWHTSLQLIWNL